MAVRGRLQANNSTINVGFQSAIGAFHGDTAAEIGAVLEMNVRTHVCFSCTVSGRGGTFNGPAALTFGTQGNDLVSRLASLSHGDTIDLTQFADDPNKCIFDGAPGNWIIANFPAANCYILQNARFTCDNAGLASIDSGLALRPDGQGGTDVVVGPIAPWSNAVSTQQWTDAANWRSDQGGAGIGAGAAMEIVIQPARPNAAHPSVSPSGTLTFGFRPDSCDGAIIDAVSGDVIDLKGLPVQRPIRLAQPAAVRGAFSAATARKLSPSARSPSPRRPHRLRSGLTGTAERSYQ